MRSSAKSAIIGNDSVGTCADGEAAVIVGSPPPGTIVGVLVGTVVGTLVAVGVLVGTTGTVVGVFDGVDVGVLVGVFEGVAVGVSVGLKTVVGVFVGVLVGVGVAVHARPGEHPEIRSVDAPNETVTGDALQPVGLTLQRSCTPTAARFDSGFGSAG